VSLGVRISAITRCRGRIEQALAPLFVAARLHPCWHRGVEAGHAGGVGVHVGGNLNARGAGGVHVTDHLIHLRPVLLTSGFEMVDLGGKVAFARDRDQLIDGLDEAVPFAAHVRDVDAAVLAGDLRQRDQFGRLGVGAGCVDERRGDAECAVVHGFARDGLHLLQLGGRWIAVLAPEDVDAGRGGAEEGADIRRDTAMLQPDEIFAKRRPFDRILDVGLVVDEFLFHRRRERPHRLTFAEDLGGHALLRVGETAAIGDERLLRLAHHVDESGRDGETVNVDFFCAAAGYLADRGDAIAADGEVAGDGRLAAAVVERGVAEDEVVVGSRGCCAGGEEHEGNGDENFHARQSIRRRVSGTGS
jgi:hypothetical protein